MSDYGETKIRTNRKWRDFTYRSDVPEKVLADQFDYQDAEAVSDGFFRYLGTWYHTDQFMRFESAGDSPLKDWHGYAGDSFFSGVVIRIHEDGDRYQVGRYYS